MALKTKDLELIGPPAPGGCGGPAIQTRKNLKSKCHPSVPMTAVYDASRAVLVLTCGVCLDPAFEISVAEK